MYGTGYSSMGSFGGLGGMSSYGGGLGGYGGGSYGNYGNSYGSGLAQNKPAVEADPNNPQQQQKNQQINQRKTLFEEWYKMMGGLKSILEMGFAAIALANFWTKSIQIYKKMMEFVQGIGKSLITFVESKIPTKMLSDLTKTERRGKVVKSLLMNMVRIFAVVLLGVGLKLRQDIIKEAKKKQQDMIEQLEKMKDEEVEMRDEGQAHEELVLENDLGSKEANL